METESREWAACEYGERLVQGAEPQMQSPVPGVVEETNGSMCLDWDEWKRSHTTEETLTTCLESHTRFAVTWKVRQLSLIVTTFSCILNGDHLGVHLAWVQHKYIYVSYRHFHKDLPTTKASTLLLLLIGSYLSGEETPGNRQLLVPASGYCLWDSGMLPTAKHEPWESAPGV